MKILIRKTVLSLFFILLFQGCSFKTPKNQWEYNSTSAFNSYTKNFFIDNEEIANDDLQRAIKYAKQSADLEQLSKIYLGSCALNIAVGENDECIEYKQIEELVPLLELKSYYLMLQNKLEDEQLKNLPKQYQAFSKHKSLGNYDSSFKTIENMEQVSSQFIAASLIKEKLDKSQIKFLVDKASFYGYKKIVLFWLNKLYEVEENLEEKEKILKKIEVLKN